MIVPALNHLLNSVQWSALIKYSAQMLARDTHPGTKCDVDEGYYFRQVDETPRPTQACLAVKSIIAGKILNSLLGSRRCFLARIMTRKLGISISIFFYSSEVCFLI